MHGHSALDIINSNRRSTFDGLTLSPRNLHRTEPIPEDRKESDNVSDPVLSGVRQMLVFLKQRVGKSDVVKETSTRRQSQRSHGGNEDDSLLQTLRLKDADNKFLQDEIERLQGELNNKETMLNMLTEGLKEVISTLYII